MQQCYFFNEIMGGLLERCKIFNFIFPSHFYSNYVLYKSSSTSSSKMTVNIKRLEMWANAQRDGRPAEYRASVQRRSLAMQ